jgi:hypothetical protein
VGVDVKTDVMKPTIDVNDPGLDITPILPLITER